MVGVEESLGDTRGGSRSIFDLIARLTHVGRDKQNVGTQGGYVRVCMLNPERHPEDELFNLGWFRL